MQPVYVGDVAEAVARALEGGAKPGTTYELGGPEVMTLREIVAFVCRTTDRQRAPSRDGEAGNQASHLSGHPDVAGFCLLR